MYKLPLHLATAFFLVLLLSGCDQICNCEEDDITPCAFSYEKVVYTPDGQPGDQLVYPQFEDEAPEGMFSVEPDGLIIDPETGAIDVNASESGKEYVVTFRIQESEVDCETVVVINEPVAKDCELKYETGFKSDNGTPVAVPGENGLIEPIFGSDTETDGIFSAVPPGLDINPKSGIISVSTSESGTEYQIIYTSGDKEVMCETNLLVSGIDYLDTVVDLEDNEGDTVSPVWNADPESSVPEGGQYDIGGRARQQGLVIDPETGSIDILQTLQQVDQIRKQNDPDQNPGESAIEEGEPLRFTFSYSVGSASLDATITSTQDIVIYWFENEISEEVLQLIQEQSLYPQNGREMSPPPVVGARGVFLR